MIFLLAYTPCVATLAAQFFSDWMFLRIKWLTNNSASGSVSVSNLSLFGIPLDTFYGYMNGMLLDNRGMYAVVLVNNQNDENVIPFFNALLQAGKGEKENWINE